MTIKDIAKKLGVSIAAVSYAINGKEGLADERRKEILDAVQQMGYIPNQQARNLVSKKNALVGIIVPDITTAYNSELIKYLEVYTHKKNKLFMLGCSSGNKDKERSLLERFIAQKMEGIILFPIKTTNGERLQSYKNIINNSGIDILIMGEPQEDIRCKFFDIQYEDGFYKLTKYLLEVCKIDDVAMLSTTGRNIYSEKKEKGFVAALEELGIDANARIYRYEKEDDYEAGKLSIAAFMQENKLPRAIMASNDISALAIIRHLEGLGYKVPQDISVTGFDGIDFSIYSDIRITSAGFDRKAFAKQCIDMLFSEDCREKSFELKVLEGNTVTKGEI